MIPKDKRPRYKDVYKVSRMSIKGFFEEHRFLSNFHMEAIWYDGLEYPSAENAYQAAKFPKSVRHSFQNITPCEAKNLGRKLKMNKEEVERWNNKRLDVMAEVLSIKFTNSGLKCALLATGDKYLEETNYWGDVFYGVHNSFGENNLGKLLMGIRSYWQLVERQKFK